MELTAKEIMGLKMAAHSRRRQQQQEQWGNVERRVGGSWGKSSEYHRKGRWDIDIAKKIIIRAQFTHIEGSRGETVCFSAG